MNAATNNSPYQDITTLKAEDGFLGTGGVVTARTALFDLYKNLMQDVNIDTLWTQCYSLTVQGTEVSEVIATQGEAIQDEIDTRVMPKFLAGYRDINSVMSSAFVVGKALIAESKVKAVNDFSAKLRLEQLSRAQDRWARTLDWNKIVVGTYTDLMKMYYTARYDSESRQLEYDAKDALWNLGLFEYGRSMVGALNGAPAASPQNLPSQAAKGIAGAMAGAGAGAAIGSSISKEGGASYGAAAGGVLGLAAAFL